MRKLWIGCCLLMFPFTSQGTEVAFANAVRGTVDFKPSGDQAEIPQRYRLDAHQFEYTLAPNRVLPVAGVEVFDLKFPSPVASPHPENNTVVAEYYRPAGDGPFPCVIVLDVTGGNQNLSRLIARHFAQKKVAGLFVQMAYYGPRRPAQGGLRLLSTDLELTTAAVTQTVLDLRRATAWMESRPEIDRSRLGIMGTSLGSFVAALTAEMEPKLGRAVVLLGGGGFVEGYWTHPKVAPYRNVFEALGGTKQMVQDVIAPIDPITCAGNLKACRLLIIAAKNDEVVPPKMAEMLWEASGRQRLIWLHAGHYTAGLHLLSGLDTLVEHFKRD